MAEDHAFFVRGEDGEDYGPVGLAELREWVAENRVGLGTQVRLDLPEEQWNAWQHYPELVALLAEAHATGAIAPSAIPILAPFGRRVTAGVIDLILSFALALPLMVTMYMMLPPEVIARSMLYSQAVLSGLMPPNPYPAWFLVVLNLTAFGVPFLYFAGFIAAHGQTPAKSILTLRVVDAQGRKPSVGKSFLRAFVFIVSVYYFYGIPLVYAFFNPQRRTLHDIAAGTYVVDS